MKLLNKMIFISCFILCVCLLSATTVFAVEDTEVPTYCVGALEIGQTAKYICYNKMSNGNYEKIVMEHNVTSNDMYMCFYLTESSVSTSGYSLNPIDTVGAMRYQYDENMIEFSSYGGNNVTNVTPIEYSNTVATNHPVQTIQFETNIPIFPTLALAKQYNGGDVSVLPQAINYKLSWANGSWVRPLEDIEINDNTMVLPELSNISFNGFSLSNRPENYAVDLYVDVGMQHPYFRLGENNLNYTNTDNPYDYYSFGYVTGSIDAAFTKDSFDLVVDFGIEPYSVLTPMNQAFYTEFPNARSYRSYVDDSLESMLTYVIWGYPFGIQFPSYNNFTKPDLSALDSTKLACNYIVYKVRYYYYDENDGMHYGPWKVVTFFNDKKIKVSSIYEDSSGDIISTPDSFGNQDDDGNIIYPGNDPEDLISLQDTNALFGNIRSIFNNITATNSTFSQLFASVFGFLPPEILAIIFGGIAAIVFIGIIKAL